LVIPFIARYAAAVVVTSGIALGPVHAKQLTICGEKVDYESTSVDAQAPSPGSHLVGIWVGELVAQNYAYSVDYSRCIAFAVEGIQANRKVVAKFVAGSSAKNINQGASFGTKPIVVQWNGQLDGSILRFESDDKKTLYELQLSSSPKIQGRYSGQRGTGRIWLTKQ
jgi:hypothetical protein